MYVSLWDLTLSKLNVVWLKHLFEYWFVCRAEPQNCHVRKIKFHSSAPWILRSHKFISCVAQSFKTIFCKLRDCFLMWNVFSCLKLGTGGDFPWWKSLKDLQGSLKISMRTFEDPTEDPDKDLYKIFKDLQGSSKFLPRSSRIFKVLTKIFKDLLFSCQDPQGSTKIFQFLAKIFKDLQRSSKFLPRSTRIFKVLAKIFKDLQNSCQDL